MVSDAPFSAHNIITLGSPFFRDSKYAAHFQWTVFRKNKAQKLRLSHPLSKWKGKKNLVQIVGAREQKLPWRACSVPYGVGLPSMTSSRLHNLLNPDPETSNEKKPFILTSIEHRWPQMAHARGYSHFQVNQNNYRMNRIVFATNSTEYWRSISRSFSVSGNDLVELFENFEIFEWLSATYLTGYHEMGIKNGSYYEFYLHFGVISLISRLSSTVLH